MARMPAPTAEEAWLAPPVDDELPVAVALEDGAAAVPPLGLPLLPV